MTQTQPKLTLPHDTKVVVPLWDHCVLAICKDPTGLVEDFYMVEWNRWGADPVTRKVSRTFALRSFEQAYPHPEPEVIPNSMTASGSIG